MRTYINVRSSEGEQLAKEEEEEEEEEEKLYGYRICLSLLPSCWVGKNTEHTLLCPSLQKQMEYHHPLFVAKPRRV